MFQESEFPKCSSFIKYLDFFDLNSIEIYTIIENLDIIKFIQFSKEKPYEYKDPLNFAWAIDCVANLLLALAKNPKIIFETTCLIICKNGMKLPDIRIAIAIFILVGHKIKDFDLYKKFGWTKKKRVLGITGVFLEFFLNEWYFFIFI